MKKALLVISFGTSYADTFEKNIVRCEEELSMTFSDRDCFRAFTSEMIIRKLSKRDGQQIDNPKKALQRLYDMGYEDVLVQSLHIINGDEFEKVSKQVDAYQNKFHRLKLGTPLLSSFDDFTQVIEAISSNLPQLNDNEHVVLMGHGATHHAFTAYACLDHLLQSKQLPIHVGAVESYPEVSLVIERLKRNSAERVHLIPLMLVAGDHAINDMASDDEDSWKTQMQSNGIAVTTWLNGLGENPAIREMFVKHLRAVANELEDEEVC
ncbi:sirohydrochlorin cobaltochelatase [Vibrio viridaestus]|uniref:Sirohydrochlorin cobaltochelatase n=1 Tax=Vibrio viridaestus TaxID=2487322 RepID=A0A3N9TK51_9VIBR|nr:sirohydrochlorin cobaltochelatase [Vibrio viridaestus]RQW64551.1 sirohydrochlorin cobaltochelatase [Vibrio viridaestus]